MHAFPLLTVAAAPDRADSAARDGGGPGVCPVPPGGAGRGEPRVPDRDGAHPGPAGLRQPRGISLRRPAQHDAEAEGKYVV